MIETFCKSEREQHTRNRTTAVYGTRICTSDGAKLSSSRIIQYPWRSDSTSTPCGYVHRTQSTEGREEETGRTSMCQKCFLYRYVRHHGSGWNLLGLDTTETTATVPTLPSMEMKAFTHSGKSCSIRVNRTPSGLAGPALSRYRHGRSCLGKEDSLITSIRTEDRNRLFQVYREPSRECRMLT